MSFSYTLIFPEKQDGGQTWRLALDPFDQFGAVQAGHDEIAEYQVDAAPAERLQRVVPVVAGDHAIAAGFQHDFADGEGLLVVVNAKNRLLGLHSFPGSGGQKPRRQMTRGPQKK